MNPDATVNNETNESSFSSNSEYKQMKLGRIRDGTVIDHIPPELCFRLIHVLELEVYNNVISAATSLNSSKMGKKGMIKISGKFLTEEEVNKVAIVAPNVSLCTVNDFCVNKKVKLVLPNEIVGIVNCNNPNCITNIEDVQTQFNVMHGSSFKIQCQYCERTIDKDKIRLK